MEKTCYVFGGEYHCTIANHKIERFSDAAAAVAAAAAADVRQKRIEERLKKKFGIKSEEISGVSTGGSTMTSSKKREKKNKVQSRLSKIGFKRSQAVKRRSQAVTRSPQAGSRKLRARSSRLQAIRSRLQTATSSSQGGNTMRPPTKRLELFSDANTDSKRAELLRKKLGSNITVATSEGTMTSAKRNFNKNAKRTGKASMPTKKRSGRLAALKQSKKNLEMTDSEMAEFKKKQMKEKKERQAKRKAAQAKKKAAEEKVKNLETKQQEAKMEIDKAAKKKQVAEQEVKNKKVELDNQKSEVEALEKEIAAATDTNEKQKMEEKAKELEKEINANQNKLQEAEEEVKKEIDLMKKEEKKVEVMEAQKEQAQTDLDDIIAYLSFEGEGAAVISKDDVISSDDQGNVEVCLNEEIYKYKEEHPNYIMCKEADCSGEVDGDTNFVFQETTNFCGVEKGWKTKIEGPVVESSVVEDPVVESSVPVVEDPVVEDSTNDISIPKEILENLEINNYDISEEDLKYLYTEKNTDLGLKIYVDDLGYEFLLNNGVIYNWNYNKNGLAYKDEDEEEDGTRYTYYSDIYGNEHEFVNGFKHSHTDDDNKDVYVDPDGYEYYFDNELGYFFYGKDNNGNKIVIDEYGDSYYHDNKLGYFYYSKDKDGNEVVIDLYGDMYYYDNELGYFYFSEDGDGNDVVIDLNNDMYYYDNDNDVYTKINLN